MTTLQIRSCLNDLKRMNIHFTIDGNEWNGTNEITKDSVVSIDKWNDVEDSKTTPLLGISGIFGCNPVYSNYCWITYIANDKKPLPRWFKERYNDDIRFTPHYLS